MLSSPDGRLVNGLVVLVSNIEHHDRSVVASSSDESRLVGVEVDGHHSTLSGELILRPGEILNCVAADETTLRI
jgi:hypothetical protein